jgi:hypothetical protein
VRRWCACTQAVGVTQDHLDISEKPVRGEHGLSALHVGVAGHDGVAGGLGLVDERTRPCGESVDDEIDLPANVETQISRDLLVAAAACVKLEAKRAYALNELQFDEVMDVFGRGMIGDERLSVFRRVVGCDGVEGCAQLRAFSLGENTGINKS